MTVRCFNIQRGGRLWELCSGLSHEIRRKVVAHAQVRQREHREVKPSAGTPAITAAPVVIGEQLSFFERAESEARNIPAAPTGRPAGVFCSSCAVNFSCTRPSLPALDMNTGKAGRLVV
jgi:hypothetical protein